MEVANKPSIMGRVDFRCKNGHVNCPGEGCKTSRIDSEGKWTPKINDELVAYFDVEDFWEEWVKSSGERGIIKERMPVRMPSFIRFELNHGLSAGLMSRWALEERSLEADGLPPKRPGFLEAFDTAKALQEEFLTQVGLQGVTPPASLIFLATNITKMRDKKEQEITGPDGQAFQVSVVHFLGDGVKKIDAKDNVAVQIQPAQLSEGSV